MIKLLSLFSGIGAFETALRRGGHEYQLIGYCEQHPVIQDGGKFHRCGCCGKDF